MMSGKKPSRFTPMSFNDVLSLPDPTYLVRKLLHDNAVSAVVGPSNSGKTFLAIDLGMHVSIGKSWFGRDVRQGTVVYVAAEGIVGLKPRLMAFKTFHGLPTTAPFFSVRAAPDLIGGPDLFSVIDEVKSLKPALIIIDTLNRTIGGREENSSEIMGAFVAACDQLRCETGAHILVVHHTGKEPSKGGRGHSSFKGALDTEIIVTDTGSSKSFKTEKQRDMAKGDSFPFELVPVDLGLDSYGDPLISCIIQPLSHQHMAANTSHLSPAERILLKEVTAAISMGQSFDVGQPPIYRPVIVKTDWVRIVAETKIVKTDKLDTIRRRASMLLLKFAEQGYVSTDGYFIWLPDKADNPDKSTPNPDGQDIPLRDVRCPSDKSAAAPSGERQAGAKE